MRRKLVCALLLLSMLVCCACSSTSSGDTATAEATAAPETSATEEPAPTETPEPEVAGMTHDELLAVLPGEWSNILPRLQPNNSSAVFTCTIMLNEDGTGTVSMWPGETYEQSWSTTWELAADLTLQLSGIEFTIADLCGYPVLTGDVGTTINCMKSEDLEDFLATTATAVTVTRDNLSDYISGPISIGTAADALGEEYNFYGVSSPAYENSGLVYLGTEGTVRRQSSYGNVTCASDMYGENMLELDLDGEEATYSIVDEGTDGFIKNVNEAVLYFIDASQVESVDFITDSYESTVVAADGTESTAMMHDVYRCVTFVSGARLTFLYLTHSDFAEGSENAGQALDFSGLHF